jgi:uncharacterized hydrophobic protein (TIGR00271 family)
MKSQKTERRLHGLIPEFVIRHFRVEKNRVGAILNDISQGSTPAVGYYALISAASLIASLGLIANSTAVVIGAMLVSPLMTPIFGIALGMIRGNALLLGKGARAEAGGVILAIAFGAFLGAFPIATDVTPEMLSRTEPTLLDLLVAVFAGFAGTLAVINERISPALPGVAISTAIVPPLSTCGLCLAFGSYRGACGALLLFTANFFNHKGHEHPRKHTKKSKALHGIHIAMNPFHRSPIFFTFPGLHRLRGSLVSGRSQRVLYSVFQRSDVRLSHVVLPRL